MAEKTHALTDYYTLNCLDLTLKDFEPPRARFDPQGAWQLAYGVYSAPRAHICARVGRLRLQRQAVGDDTFALRVTYEKTLPADYTQIVTAHLECRADALSTPVRWTWSTVTQSPEGEAVAATQLERAGEARAGEVTIRDAGAESRIPVAAAVALNWALFDAVQRLPREAVEPLRFTLIDHFDQIKPNQTLCFRQSAKVSLGGQRVRLYAYDQFGQGVVPWEYWVDDQGRLLFAIGGIEAYLVESSK